MTVKFDALLSKLRESDENPNDKGRFTNYAAIIAAYPTGQSGWYVINYDTDTFWVWDADTNAWVDTDRKGEVSSVFGRTGAVTAQSGDYSADEVSFDPSGSSLDSTNVSSAIKELDFKVVNTSSDVNPAVANTIYYVDTSSAEITVKLPNITTTNNAKIYRFYKITDTNDLIVTTVGGTQLIGDQLIQVIVNENAGFTVQANYSTMTYEIIQDSRPKVPTASVTKYATNTSSGISDYKLDVTNTNDSRYDSVAIDATTAAITGAAQYIAGFISDPGIINGLIPETNIITYGNLKKNSGISNARFYVLLYKRNAAGVETLICTSSKTVEITNSTYTEFYVTGLLISTTFEITDRLLTKIYADKVGTATSPVYSLQLGGTAPARTIISIPSGGVTHDSLAAVQQIADGVEHGHIKLFQKDFTSSDSTGFVWTDNVLTVTHSLNISNPSIIIKDNSSELIDTYYIEVVDVNNIKIYFPVEAIPITSTWNIKIF